jgi:hypothetical protein
MNVALITSPVSALYAPTKPLMPKGPPARCHEERFSEDRECGGEAGHWDEVSVNSNSSLSVIFANEAEATDTGRSDVRRRYKKILRFSLASRSAIEITGSAFPGSL